MTQQKDSRTQDKTATSTANLAAGGGSGGVLVYLTNTYISDPKLQNLAIYLIPTITLILTSVYTTAMRMFIAQWDEWAAERKRRKMLARAQEGLRLAVLQLKAIEENGNASASHKEQARKRVETFELLILDLTVRGIVASQSDPPPATEGSRAS